MIHRIKALFLLQKKAFHGHCHDQPHENFAGIVVVDAAAAAAAAVTVVVIVHPKQEAMLHALKSFEIQPYFPGMKNVKRTWSHFRVL